MKQSTIKIGILTLLMVCGLMGCKKEPTEVVVDDRVLPYLETFLIEAAQRDVDGETLISQISFIFTDIESENIAGKCKAYSNGMHAVEIDEKEWAEFSLTEKEYLIFHELGHCALKRDHNDNNTDDGSCISIMESGKGLCVKRYNGITRDHLIDELFQGQ